jgi:hypothetical protein
MGLERPGAMRLGSQAGFGPGTLELPEREFVATREPAAEFQPAAGQMFRAEGPFARGPLCSWLAVQLHLTAMIPSDANES